MTVTELLTAPTHPTVDRQAIMLLFDKKTVEQRVDRSTITDVGPGDLLDRTRGGK